jgi:hypothetical protein
MGLSATDLGDALKAMALYDNETAAIAAWADAYATYFEEASSNGVPINPLALPVAKAAMIGAMTGLSTAAAVSIQAGALAFWGALVPPTAWVSVTVITPPPLLSGLSGALTTVFTANIVGQLSKDASMDAIAAAIHTNSLGGTATWPTPVGPQPIL